MRSDPRLVLVVDAEESVRLFLKRLLRSAGYEVRTFAETQALFPNRRRPESPCCVVLDLHLGEMNALQYQRHLRSIGIHVPVIILSRETDVGTGVAAMKAGAHDFITKPISEDHLLSSVARAIMLDSQASIENQHLAELEQCYQTLTAREREVFGGVVAGLLNKQIGLEMGITEKTVKIHRGRVMEKMHAGSLAELVRAATALEYNHLNEPRESHAEFVA